MNPLELIYMTIDLINSDLAENEQIKKSPQAFLWGAKGPLDSLMLVRFIVLLEQKTEEVTGKKVNLTSEEAFLVKNSPFENVSKLEKYLSKALQANE